MLFLILLTVSSSLCSAGELSDKTAEPLRSDKYWPSLQCRSCHVNIFEQHVKSMHAKSFTNPVFQAQYFRELVPAAAADPDFAEDAKSCMACHAPVAYMQTKRHILSIEEVDSRMSGVTCDFCHTLKGYKDKSPQNGNYISAPGEQKLGPFMYTSPLPWHKAYSELHTMSEFCAICHNQVNRHGLEIKSTFTEWKNSPYAKEGIQCQDCHMSVQGFLTAGKPVYDEGKAARTSLAHPRYRPELHTHLFPGARSMTQVVGALTLDIKVSEPTASAGTELQIYVFVDNSRTGHKMPSGSADLRLLWLELKAYVFSDKKMRTIPIVMSPGSESRGTYSIAGYGAVNREILQDDIPAGNRIYRAVFVDKTGKQTLSSHNATEIIFDNRLKAAEIRKETYSFIPPEDADDKLYLFASLHYLPYPGSFAKRLGLPEPDGVVIASAKEVVALE